MLEVKINVPELKDYVKNLVKNKKDFFPSMNLDLNLAAKNFINAVLCTEFEIFIGRDKHERQSAISVTERNYYNGTYSRSLNIKDVGKVTIRVPRDRKGEYCSEVLEPYRRIDGRLEDDMAISYLFGTSTRGLSLISKRLFGVKVSHSQISQYAEKLTESVEAWRTQRITESYKYLYIDGTNFKMRVTDSIEIVTVLVVIGVNSEGVKKVLALQAGDKESSSNWRELFKDLKIRGLDKNKVKLGIMDGLSGLELVFKDEFPQADIQRCQVHVQRNILCKVPKKLKEEVADDVRSVFYSKTKNKALEFAEKFNKKWSKDLPSAVKCLESSLEQTLTYLKYPEEEWLSLRTTNPIERLNKEYKRRTKTMEIVAGEKSCYNLLAVVSLRMEAYWQKHPITFQKSVPWFGKDEEVTQKI